MVNKGGGKLQQQSKQQNVKVVRTAAAQAPPPARHPGPDSVVSGYGLPNIGNTCFINSAIQMGFSTHMARRIVEKAPPALQAHPTKWQAADHRMACCLRDVVCYRESTTVPEVKMCRTCVSCAACTGLRP